MTWQELADKISQMHHEQRNQDVTVLCMNQTECYPIMDFVTDWTRSDVEETGLNQVCGVLDYGHAYLTIPA